MCVVWTKPCFQQYPQRGYIVHIALHRSNDQVCLFTPTLSLIELAEIVAYQFPPQPELKALFGFPSPAN